MRFLTLSVATLAACGTAPVAAPCTTCPDVAGRYHETRAAQSVTCKDGSTLSVRAVSRDVTITQAGSRLQVPESSMTGTLFEDLTVGFDAFATVAINVNTGAEVPAHAYLTGRFDPGTGPRRMGATLLFTIDATQCRLNEVSEWVPLAK